MGCVYIATLGDRHGYIGKTVKSLDHRRRQHICAAMRDEDKAFCRALRKYDPALWSWSELYVSDCNDSLLAAEVALIRSYRDSGMRLYNSTDGGEGTVGRLHSLTTKAMLSERAKVRRASPETRRKISVAGKGRRQTDTDKANKSAAMRAYWDARRTQGLAMKHGEVSDAGRARLAESARQRWADAKGGGSRRIGKPAISR